MSAPSPRSRRAPRRSAASPRAAHGERRRARPAPTARRRRRPARGRGGSAATSSACQALRQMPTSTARSMPRWSITARCRRRTRGRRRPRSRRPVGAAVAARVDGDDAVVLREVGHLPLPRPAVHDRVDRDEQQAGRSSAGVAEPTLVADPHAVRARRTPARQVPVPACRPTLASVGRGGCSAVAIGLQRRRSTVCVTSIHPGCLERETPMTTIDQNTDRTQRPADQSQPADRHGRADGVRRRVRRRPRRHHRRRQRAAGRPARPLPRPRRRARPTPARSPPRRAPTRATSRSGCAGRRPAATSSTTPATATYSMTPEQAFALTDPDGPGLPARRLRAGARARSRPLPEIEHAFRTGGGYGWHEHDERRLHRLRAVLPARLPDAPAARVDPGPRRASARARAGRPGRRPRLRPRRVDAC